MSEGTKAIDHKRWANSARPVAAWATTPVRISKTTMTDVCRICSKNLGKSIPKVQNQFKISTKSVLFQMFQASKSGYFHKINPKSTSKGI